MVSEGMLLNVDAGVWKIIKTAEGRVVLKNVLK